MPQSSRAAVLVVEDDESLANLTKLRLAKAGYQVIAARTPREALAELAKTRIALILLDYCLPGEVTGLEFYEQVKAAGFRIPVIMVTAHTDEATAIKALRAGIRDYIAKSSELLEYLPEAVERVLSQVQTEQNLAKSEARLAGVIESAKDAIIMVELDQRISLFNPAAERMFACSAEKALGQPVHRFIPKELSLPIKGACDADLSTSSLTVLFRYGSRGVRADGASFPLEASLSKGQIDGRKFYTLVVRDITDRRRAEERIEEQAELLNIANDAIVVRDLEDRITYWNQGAERLYGWSESQALGRHAAEIMDKPLSPELDQAHTALRTVGEWSGELRQIAKDGTELIVASRWKVVRDQADVPKAKLIINTDITEKKRLEMQFLHSQKLEAIGTLAGGVAHDFNNLLTVIAGFSDLLLKRAPLDEANAELLREIRKASDKASILTRQLLAFSRKQMLRPQVVDLNQLIEDMRNMLRRLIGEDIQFLARLHERPCPVKADPGQLEQVVLNLVVNARDAMPTGGRLEIETSIQDLPSAAASGPSSMEPGRYARLSLTDSGHGMSPQTKARIFEPFFTTKEVGKGTGLGLAAVYGIVKQSGGQVEVDSAPGTGTRFTIYLPCVESVPAPPRKSSAILGVLHATETILLVEDEECVRTLARHTLQANGYEVIEAKDGAEALTMARDHDGPIHALVTDVVMPKLSGRELAEALGRQRPAVKVLYLSGYTGEAIRRYGVSDEEMDVLQKPFSPMELARRVREMLDRASSIPCPETLE